MAASRVVAAEDGNGIAVERLIEALTASVDPVSLVWRIADQARLFMPKADGAAVSLWHADSDTYVVISTSGAMDAMSGVTVPRQSSFQGYAAQQKRPQLIHDAPVDERLTPDIRELNKQLGIRSWAVIPLLHNDTAVGSLLLGSARPAAFSSADVEAMLATSEFVSALIGHHSELSELLTRLMTDSDTRGQRATAAQFVASVMLPEAPEFNDGLQDQLDALLSYPTVLRAAFQPMVDLSSGTTIGFEGLARFPASPSNLSPAQWFGAARRMGHGVELERAALCAILAAARTIPDQSPVGVNLSPTAALDPSVQKILAVQDRALVLEITEHEPFPPDLDAGLQPLRDRGIRVAVDDVGAGYASLTQLLRLRPDIIKIDGELIDGIDACPVKRAIVRALAGFASEINSTTVAEAVETSEQVETLISLGVGYGQGFYLGRPEVAEDPTSAARGS